jgi:carbon-monoxide dehydrogenase large subunit
MDLMARELGMDAAELRRRNYIPTASFPNHTIASGLTVDSGDYPLTHDAMIAAAGYDEFRREQAKRRASGDTKQIGIGLSCWTEMCGLAPSRVLHALKYVAGGWDAATIEMLPTGTVRVLIGVSPHGQGHVTTFSQIVADRLGVDIEAVEVLHGDTAVSSLGMDTYGSRSLSVGGVAVWQATEKVLDKARRIAAHQLEVDEQDLEFANGRFAVRGTDRGMTVPEAAFSAWTSHNLPDGVERTLTETAVYDPPNFSWPGGCHVAVVEVDTETGDTRLVRYVAVDEVGTVINPAIVDGQVHGGISQGVAQALFEEAVYDSSGNLVNGSLAGYLVPSAAELPSFELERISAPSPTNPMGVKGVGETGAIASTAAVMNAVVDALAPLGVEDVAMPASPERVWRAIQEARA